MLYCSLQVVGCLAKQSSNLKGPYLAHMCLGSARSLYFSVFEAWMTAEHEKVDFSISTCMSAGFPNCLYSFRFHSRLLKSAQWLSVFGMRCIFSSQDSIWYRFLCSQCTWFGCWQLAMCADGLQAGIVKWYILADVLCRWDSGNQQWGFNQLSGRVGGFKWNCSLHCSCCRGLLMFASD